MHYFYAVLCAVLSHLVVSNSLGHMQEDQSHSEGRGSVGKARQGRQGLGLATLNNFCRVWSVGTILVGWYLAL